MNKNIFKLLVLSILLVGCFKDDTLNGGQPIIEISIKNDVKDTINIYFNDVLNINSQIDAGESKQVNCQWGFGKYKQTVKEDVYGESYMANTTVFETVSTDMNLSYIPRELGHYMVRQVVTNEHGSTIKYHHVFVNSPFEEGFMILSRQPDGTGNMSFLKTLTPEEIEMGMKPEFHQNVYRDVNGKDQYKDPVDVFKIGSSIYLMYCDDQRLVRLNDKTLEVILEYDFRYYDINFKPTSAAAYDGKYCTEVTVASLNGGAVQVQLRESGIFPFTSPLPEGYKFTHIYARPSYFSSVTTVFLSSDRNVVCWSGANEKREFEFLDCYAYFKDREVLHIFQDEESDGNSANIINRKGSELKITQIGSSITDLQKGGLALEFEHNIPYPQMIDDNTNFLRSDKYSCVFFSYKNGVYKWYYSQSGTMPAPEKRFCELPEGEEVRFMAHYVVERTLPAGIDYRKESADRQTEIYVATYNPNRAGEYKGSLYIFSSETGAEIARYEGISYEPIEVMYKNK